MYTIWIDMTCIYQTGKFSGVPKTTWNLAKEMLLQTVKNGNEKVRVCLWQTTNNEAKFCREMEREILNDEQMQEEEKEVNFQRGDVLLLPNTNYNVGYKMIDAAKTGLCIIPFLHDIIPLTHPEFCHSNYNEHFQKWIESFEQFESGIICNSAFTINSYRENFSFKYPIEFVHLGCDKKNFEISPLSILPKGINVLMVSTIEPRKKYAETLEQFEKIWKTRDDINLIIVGSKGWNVDNLIDKMVNHPRQHKNLFNVCKLSEGQLNFLYQNCNLFLFASEIEGFGLGVIEAARFGTPLLLRDIPVFREIAGDHATYFQNFSDLPDLICKNEFKRSDGMRINSWADSGRNCLQSIDKIRDCYMKTHE